MSQLCPIDSPHAYLNTFNSLYISFAYQWALQTQYTHGYSLAA